jgi:16S rRNA (cytidine1402-2'-O)-methyltransferase
MVLLFAPAALPAGVSAPELSITAEVEALMQAENLTEKDALKRVARERGIGKSEAYRELQREQKRLR